MSTLHAEHLIVFAFIFSFLVLLGVLTALWIKVFFLMLGVCLKTAYNVGLYRPSLSGKRSHQTAGIQRDHSSLQFVQTLEFVSGVIPGDSNIYTHTWIIPLLVVGVPVVLVMAVVAVIVPVSLLWYVIATGPAPWSLLLAVLSVCTYFSLLLVIYYLSTHTYVNKNRPNS